MVPAQAERKIFSAADGVGGYRMHGIDCGKYARELKFNAVDAIAEMFKLPCYKNNDIDMFSTLSFAIF